MAMAMIAGDEVAAGDADRMALPRRLAIMLLLLVSEFLYGWAWNTVDVLRPYLQQSLHLSRLQAGSMYSAQGPGALIGAVVIGQLADRFGRRNMLALVIFGYGSMLLAGTLVASYPELLAQRFCLGLFMGASFPVSVGIYVNLFHPRLRGLLAGMLNACFGLSLTALGLGMGLVGADGWRLLFWIGGVPPIILSGIALLLIPGHSAIDRFHVRPGKLPISELFHRGVRRQTLLLATMTGLNFFGFEAFSGWLTSYLPEDRRLSLEVAGTIVAAVSTGYIIGGFVWGWIADRLGRRFNALGFFVAAAAIAAFLTVPTSVGLLRLLAFVYGFTICSQVIWGPWMAELYPPHLRSTAASIFNWGRVISFFAPLVTAAIAGSFGLTAAMGTASVAFFAAALIWTMQRETLDRETRNQVDR